MKNVVANYDLIKSKLNIDDPWYQMIFQMLKLVLTDYQGKRFLEVGCGIGGFSINLAKKGAKVVGLDISCEAVNEAKKLMDNVKLKNKVAFIIGDAQHLPFKDRSNEILICSETLEHIPNYQKGFNELVRVIEKSGLLCMTVPNILSSLLLEEVILLLIKQPKYARNIVNVEVEHIFHIFKLKNLVNRKDLEVINIKSTDFIHLSPSIKKALKIEYPLNRMSNQIERYLESNIPKLRYFGAHLGVIARKK